MALPTVNIPTGVKLPEGMTPELLAAAMAVVQQFQGLAKDARQVEADRMRESFGAMLPALQPILDGITTSEPMQTWHKTDRKTKKKTTEVSGIGYHVRGATTLTFPDGTVREVSVNVWVKANPNNGIPPLPDGESDGDGDGDGEGGSDGDGEESSNSPE